MKIQWNKLPAARMAQPQIAEMLKFMEAEDRAAQAEYMKQYLQLPEQIQCALGYMRCLIESGYLDTYSAYGRFCMDAFRRVPPMRLPIRFIGWGGEHSDIGPAYEMDSGCVFGETSRIFYTDDSVAHDEEYAQYLSDQIAKESSGLADVRAEKLNSLRTMDSENCRDVWGVTFRLCKEAQHDIIIGGRTMSTGANGSSLFILPRVGEFDCTLGEVVDGDPENCFILAKHSYCMK